MADVAGTILEGLKQSFLMAYEVWWALVFGFAISAIAQTWVPRQRVEAALSGSGPKPLGLATGLGAAVGILARRRPGPGDDLARRCRRPRRAGLG